MRPIFNAHFKASPMDRWTFDFSTSREFLAVTPRAILQSISSYSWRARPNSPSTPGHFCRLARRAATGAMTTRASSREATLRKILRYNNRFSVDAGLLDSLGARSTTTPNPKPASSRPIATSGTMLTWACMATCAAFAMRSVDSVAPSRYPARPLIGPIGTSLRLFRSRSAGGFELSANYQRRNYSLVTRDGWYQGFQFTIGIKK